MILRVKSGRETEVGPYTEATHAGHGSIRFLGFDPEVGPAGIVGALRIFGFREPMPLLAADGATLVIADTSGLHYRGFAPPGATRQSVRMDVPRKNQFLCMTPARPC